MHPVSERTVSLRDLVRILRRSYRTVARLTRKPGFPAPLPISRKFRRWLASDINSWLAKHNGTSADAELHALLQRCIDKAGPGSIRDWLQKLANDRDLDATPTATSTQEAS